jgi:hypothetical protein
MGKPQAGESTGDYGQGAPESAFQGERCRRFGPHFGLRKQQSVSLANRFENRAGSTTAPDRPMIGNSSGLPEVRLSSRGSCNDN